MDNTDAPAKAALWRAAVLLDGQAAIATACGYEDRRHVWPWFNTDRKVPIEKCPLIELACGAQITCEQLRPDVGWGRIRDARWPHPSGRPVHDLTKALA